MERAEFVFQVFFETATIPEGSGPSEFSLSFRLFELPSVAVAHQAGGPGDVDLSTGKRIALKLPYVEVLEDCPLTLFYRSPRPQRTDARAPPHRVNLHAVFSFAVRAPGRCIQKHFSEPIRDAARRLLATVHFAVNLVYAASGQGDAPRIAPLVLPAESSAEEDASQRSAARAKRARGTYVREVTPEVPQRRVRSIFYFDRADLMEENRVLAAEVATLRRQVGELRTVVGEARAEARGPQSDRWANRTDYIYHPPGLARTRGGRKARSARA
jgi:hypothetical protein